MKKYILIGVILLNSIFVLNVNAATSPAFCEHELTSMCSNPTSDYTKKKGLFESDKKYTVNSSETITVYGKSECNGSTCTIIYMGNKSDIKDVLVSNVICSGGETNINYQNSGGGKSDYNTTNVAKLTGTAYWDEDYLITCTSNNTGSSNVTLKSNTGSSNSSNSSVNSNNNFSSSSINSSSSSITNNYNSSTTVDAENTGVETYFVVLIVFALLTYVIMLVFKRKNLFHKI